MQCVVNIRLAALFLPRQLAFFLMHYYCYYAPSIALRPGGSIGIFDGQIASVDGFSWVVEFSCCYDKFAAKLSLSRAHIDFAFSLEQELLFVPHTYTPVKPTKIRPLDNTGLCTAAAKTIQRLWASSCDHFGRAINLVRITAASNRQRASTV